MSYRMLSLLLATLALACFVGLPFEGTATAAKAKKGQGQQEQKDTAKDKKEKKKDAVYEVTIVKVGDGKLTATDKKGKKHSHSIAKDATITLDGATAKLKDLKKGAKAKVTVKDKKITKIEATSAKK
jgi:hypothetical protein